MSATTDTPAILKQGYSNTHDLSTFIKFCLTPVESLANMVSPCFGPSSSYKLILNETETPHLVSTSSRLLYHLKVANPIARVLERCVRSLSETSPTAEGSTYFILLVRELFRAAAALISEGIPRPKVTAHVRAFVKELSLSLDAAKVPVGDGSIGRVLRGCLENNIATKLATRRREFTSVLGREEFLHGIAALEVGRENFAVLRSRGRPVTDSKLFSGLILEALPLSPLPAGAPADRLYRVALYGCNLELAETDAKGTILLQSAAELLDFRKDEESLLGAKVGELCQAGVTLVLTNGSVSGRCRAALERRGISALEVASKVTMLKVARLAGCAVQSRFEAPERPGELRAEVVCLDELNRGDKRVEVTLLRGAEGEGREFYTLVVASPIDVLAEVAEDAITDTVGVLEVVARDRAVVAGGGQLESALLHHTKGMEVEFAGRRERIYEAIPRSLENMLAAVLKNSSTDNVVGKVLAGKGAVGFDVEKDRFFEGDEECTVFDSFFSRKRIFELVDEVIDMCLSVDSIYFSKVSGGPDFMNYKAEKE